MTRPIDPTLDPAAPVRRRWRWRGLRACLTGVAALLSTSPALAGVGTGLLDVFAAARGHRGEQDVVYGPRARERFDLYRPKARAAGALPSPAPPLVVFVYGGTWSSGSRADYRFVGEALAAEGFVVMVVDYRLYPDVHFPGFVQDCADAAGYALDHAATLGADPHRVFLYGHSAGAYNVAMLALDPRWLAAVGHRPGELAGWVGLAGPYNFLPIVDPTTRLVFDWPATAPDTQPIEHVADLAQPRPAFLGAPEEDRLVDPDDNTRLLAQRLRDRGARVTYRRYARVGHALLVGSLGWPLTPLSTALADTADFIRTTPPAP